VSDFFVRVFRGSLRLINGSTYEWTPNPFLEASSEEQYNTNQKNGYFDNMNIVVKPSVSKFSTSTSIWRNVNEF